MKKLTVFAFLAVAAIAITAQSLFMASKPKLRRAPTMGETFKKYDRKFVRIKFPRYGRDLGVIKLDGKFYLAPMPAGQDHPATHFQVFCSTSKTGDAVIGLKSHWTDGQTQQNGRYTEPPLIAAFLLTKSFGVTWLRENIGSPMRGIST